ncbi:MAG: 5-methyltetrahydropteroyltriglutamate--homocysteine S-methyltransferase [Burkholderiales bacterium]
MSLSQIGKPPFRADHIGSLLRPASLRAAFKRHGAGEMTDVDFNMVLDQSIRDVLRLQEDCGLAVVNDGEFRRGSYWSRFVERMEGFRVGPAVFKFHDDAGRETAFTAPYVKGKLRRVRPIALDEVRFIVANSKRTAKITLPSAPTMQFYSGPQGIDPGVYPDREAMFADLGRAFGEEIKALHAAGLRYVQIDEVPLAMLCDAQIRQQVRAMGDDPEHLVDLYIDALNQSVANLPNDLVVGLHLCRGNLKGTFLSEGGLDPVAEKMFARINVNHFLIEYDTPRAGDFAALRFVPKNKGVVLGLVSSKTPALESIDMLKRRTEEATRYIDLDRLAISPQCGFASTVAGNPVTEADESAKLRRCVDAAEAIWKTSGAT